MVRLPGIVAVALALHSGVAMAGQASASFGVGLVIGGPPAPESQSSAVPLKTYTWGAAEISVVKAGYADPARAGQSQTVYWFEAERDGQRYRIAVSRFTGRIVRVIAA